MYQAKLSISETQRELLNKHKQYGFKDKSSMVRAALNDLKRKLELEKLKESAELYAEIYEEDAELKELTESALIDWPEE